MIGLGWMEILILLACAGVFFLSPVVVAIVFFATARARSGESGGTRLPAQPAPAQSPAPYDASATSIDLVARLTQRFCPQCRTALAADSPEGLCPACLMAGALASRLDAPDPGMEATTPPSGSQPPATGEWSDLAARFPQLEILELLGRGGMGTVYKARQRNLDRIIALKVIPPDAAADPAFAERFAREARAMARLNHPNIVTVYDFGHDGNLYWLMMEYVDGVNLRHTLRASHLQPREALAIIPQVCDALQYAHDQGVVHRDIKPENVLLDRSGRVKIADFGLAKLLGKGPDDFTLTRTQQVMGTPRYMAPEQIERPTTVDHRADIYSLGVVLYEMLTGELPLGRFDPPSHKVQVDVRIDQVVLRALEKAPERRYQRASEIKTDLASSVNWATPAATASATPSASTPPAWHTPAPASKDSPTQYPSFPGGMPLAQVLMVAFGIVMGVLMMTAGLAAIIYGFVYSFGAAVDSAVVFSWWGAGFGCLVGGFGSAAGSYNTYRQMAGAEDLLRSKRMTWFDRTMYGYLAFGLALSAIGGFCSMDGATREFSLPLFLIGGIATFQAAIFVLWRTSVRLTGPSEPASAASHAQAAEPGYFRAVVLPTLAMAGVFGLLLADVYFALPSPHVASGITPKMTTYRQWYEVVLVTGLIAVPLCAMTLGAWRAWGPRQQDVAGRWAVSFPFSHCAWLWAIAGLAALSLLLPWFQLEVQPQAVVDFRFDEVFSGPRPESGIVSVQEKADGIRFIAGIPDTGRYALRGLQAGHTAAAACLVIFAAIISAFAFEPRHPARIGFLLVSAAVSLVLVTTLLHRGADQRPDIVVDDTAEEGLFRLATQSRGLRPTTVEPWRHAISQAIVARPAVGVIALLAASGLAILVGTTELCWGAIPAAGTLTAPAKPVAVSQPLDPVREKLRAKVAGPAIGLMIAGVLGLAPFCVVLLAVPAWTIHPMQGQPYREPFESVDQYFLPPSSFLPLVATQSPAAAIALQSASFLHPLILAQSSEPQRAFPMVWLLIVPIVSILTLAQSATLIIGGWQMRKLRSYGLVFIAAVLAVLPCTFAWVVGLPMGIWAFVVLMDPEVKAGFEA